MNGLCRSQINFSFYFYLLPGALDTDPYHLHPTGSLALGPGEWISDGRLRELSWWIGMHTMAYHGLHDRFYYT